MRAIQILAPETVEVVDVPVPEIAPDEVLVKVRTCVTCPHWDITLYRGVDIFERPGHPHYPIPPGYPGHEMAGDVTAVGAEVTGLKVGDRVATLCNAGETTMGYYCEFINRPEDTVAAIPDSVSYDAGASLEMARYVASYVRLLGDVGGKRVGVTGMGPAGLIALQILKALGAREVVAVDLIDGRLELARQLGADQTVNAGDMSAVEERPFEASVDCSGASAGLQLALDHTEGRIAIFGVPHGEITYGLRHWGRSLLSGTTPAGEDTQQALDLWRAGTLNTEALVTHRLPFEHYADGIELLIAREAIKVAFSPDLP